MVARAPPALELAAAAEAASALDLAVAAGSTSPLEPAAAGDLDLELAASVTTGESPNLSCAVMPRRKKKALDDALTEYEKLRAKNMARNKQFFQRLGLESSLADLWSSPHAILPIYGSISEETCVKAKSKTRDELNAEKKKL